MTPASGVAASRSVGALEGLVVLDLTHVLAGPYASMLMGDLGATVVKIEPPAGEDNRRTPPIVDAMSAGFRMVNRNKHSLTLDLTHPQGIATFRRLARQADVLIENYSPGALDRLGIGWRDLSAVNPRLVMASISGFGQTGPYSGRKGLDLIAQAMSGMMSVTGEADGPPVKCGLPITDLGAGLHATVAILAALRHRDRTGEGQYVETSLFEVAAGFAVWQAAEHWGSGRVPQRWGSAHPLIAPYEAFRTRDGHIVLAAWSQRHWRIVCEALGVVALTDDPRFAAVEGRLENRALLHELLEAVLLREDSATWIDRLEKAGIPAGPIHDYGQVFRDPHLVERGMVTHPDGEVLPVLGNPVKLSLTPWRFRQGAPRLGEHTRAVLRRFGFSDHEIERLAAAGAAVDTRQEEGEQ